MAKKYRIKIGEERVLGPIIAKQFEELYEKGIIDLSEQVQEFPNGNWKELREFSELKYLLNSSDPTLFKHINELRDEIKKEEEEKLDFLDKELEKDHKEFRPGEIEEKNEVVESIDESTDRIDLSKGDGTESINVDLDKTIIRKLDDKNLERTVVRNISELPIEEVREVEIPGDEKEGEVVEVEEEIQEESKREEVDFEDGTKVLNLDEVKKELIEEVRESEKEIKRASKVLPSKIEVEKIEHEEIESEEAKKKKKRKLFNLLVGLVLVLAAFEVFWPKKESTSFSYKYPKITYPIAYQNEKKQESKNLFGKGQEYLFKGDYNSLLKASSLFRSSLENSIGNNDALGKLILTYGLLFKNSKTVFKDSRELAKLIQLAEKRIPDNIDYVVGSALFYNQIDRPLSGKILIERYIRLKQPLSDILLTTYLDSLIQLGNVGDAKKVFEKIQKLPTKTKYVYMAMANYKFFVEDDSGASKILEEGYKEHPQSIEIFGLYGKYLLRKSDFKTLYKITQSMAELKAGNSPYYYSELLKFQGVLAAVAEKNSAAIKLFKLSLEINDDKELRKKLESLEADPNSKKEMAVFINENKTIQFINKSKRSLRQENYGDALKYAIEALDINGSYYPAVKQMSIVQRKRGHFKNAIELLEKYIANNPTNYNPIFDLIETYTEARKFDAAKRKLAQVNKVEEDLERRYAFALGKLYMVQENYLPAVNWLRKAINLDPLNDEVLYLMSEIYLRGGKLGQAKNLINKAIELNPGNVYYRSLYGQILFELDGPDVAIGYVRSQLEAFSAHPQLIGDIAKFYFKSGQIKLFNEQMEVLNGLPNKTADLYRLLFESSILEERPEKAIEYGNELMLLAPGDLQRKTIFAEYLIENKKYERAFEVLEDIKNRLDTYPRLYLLISRIFMIKGDLDEAIRMGKREVSNNPGRPEVHSHLGDLYVKKENWIEAKKAYESAQSINPDHYESLTGLGHVYFKLGRYETSLQFLQKANSQRSSDPQLMRQIAYVYLRLGQRDLARESFKMYLNLDPNASDKSEIKRILGSLR